MFHDADHGALEAAPLLLLVGQAVGGAVGERPHPLDQVVRNHAGDVAVAVTNELLVSCAPRSVVGSMGAALPS